MGPAQVTPLSPKESQPSIGGGGTSCPEDIAAIAKFPNPPRRAAGERRSQIGEEEEDGAGGDLLRDVLRGVPLLAVHGQGPRLDRAPPGREGELITGSLAQSVPLLPLNSDPFLVDMRVPLVDSIIALACQISSYVRD